MSASRGRNLGAEDIEAIVRIIDGWKGPLTWGQLIDAVQLRLYSKYTRQALSKHQRISLAFRRHKQALKDTSAEKSSKYLSPELKTLQERLARRESEVARLHRENELLMEQFVIWLYNAHLHGLSPADLNRPLPPVHRGQTRVELASVRGRGGAI